MESVESVESQAAALQPSSDIKAIGEEPSCRGGWKTRK